MPAGDLARQCPEQTPVQLSDISRNHGGTTATHRDSLAGAGCVMTEACPGEGPEVWPELRTSGTWGHSTRGAQRAGQEGKTALVSFPGFQTVPALCCDHYWGAPGCLPLASAAPSPMLGCPPALSSYPKGVGRPG